MKLAESAPYATIGVCKDGRPAVILINDMFGTKGAANAAGLTPVPKDRLGIPSSCLAGPCLMGFPGFFDSFGLLGLLFRSLLCLAHSLYLTKMALTPFPGPIGLTVSGFVPFVYAYLGYNVT